MYFILAAWLFCFGNGDYLFKIWYLETILIHANAYLFSKVAIPFELEFTTILFLVVVMLLVLGKQRRLKKKSYESIGNHVKLIICCCFNFKFTMFLKRILASLLLPLLLIIIIYFLEMKKKKMLFVWLKRFNEFHFASFFKKRPQKIVSFLLKHGTWKLSIWIVFKF